ncbi:MAG: hypothetical protein AMJ69_03185 [Gammaproteobacteria bacterium SG8_47]|nr:MAG: hypothetical protein AMJ69_03185 [Gammaproteobacteria bacterium SG8_47]
MDRAEGAELRALFTAQALALQQRGETLRAVALLKAYLSVEHDDIDALALLAQCRVQLGDHAGALEALYAARGFAAQVEQQALFTQRIRALVPQYRARLESRADHEALAAMFADLITLEPDYAPYRIGLAQAQLALGDVAAAEATLQSAGQTSALDAQLASLRAQLDGGSGGESVGASVALQPAGEHFLVEAVLNGRRKLTLLLDTGASLTLISAAALRDAGLWPQYDSERMRLQTANGPIDVALLQVETLSLGTQTVADLQVGAWELDTPHGFDGLLGVDFLNRFDYVVDRRSAQLRFMAKTP